MRSQIYGSAVDGEKYLLCYTLRYSYEESRVYVCA